MDENVYRAWVFVRERSRVPNSQAFTEPTNAHPRQRRTAWRESMPVWWCDAAAGLSGRRRIGQMPNDGVAECIVRSWPTKEPRFRRSGSAFNHCVWLESLC